MRTPLLLLVLAASVSGCAAVRDPSVTAGATLGTDTHGFGAGMPLGGAFVGVRTTRVGVEAGAEAGRRMGQIYHTDAGPSRQQMTAVQAYANARYTLDGGRHYRLYVLTGARYYRGSTMYTDSAEYGIDPDDTRAVDDNVFLNAGAGVGYGPAAIEVVTSVPFLGESELHPLKPGLALRARVSVPVLRLGRR